VKCLDDELEGRFGREWRSHPSGEGGGVYFFCVFFLSEGNPIKVQRGSLKILRASTRGMKWEWAH
jgi:hypothetical protein